MDRIKRPSFILLNHCKKNSYSRIALTTMFIKENNVERDPPNNSFFFPTAMDIRVGRANVSVQ